MAPRTASARDIASESEDDLATANAAPSARARGAAKGKSMVKAGAKRKAAPRQPRQALKDRTNEQSAEIIEDDEEPDDEAIEKPKTKRAKTTAAPRKRTEAGGEGSVDPAPLPTRASSGTKKPRAMKAAPTSEPLRVIPETQQDPEQVEDVELSIEVDEACAPLQTHYQTHAALPRARSGSVQPLYPRPSARSASVQPSYPQARERSASVSGTERERRGGDPEMRRKLNDVTRKYENLQLKFQALDDIAKTRAETNFEKLKRATDQKTKDADELIVSLKKQIVELQKSSNSITSETAALQKQITTSKANSEKQAADNEKLKAEAVELRQAVAASQDITKSLEAKLLATRQQISNAVQEKAPGPEVKNGNKSAVANATEAQKEARMKENLYSDLTGLIIRGVKRKEGEDQYDCIQTGRNGTLHFHLSIANDASVANPKTPTGLSYEEAEFSYEPLLDESRDRDLLELLPDYLTEEICFPRNHAVKFYTKVVESMTMKVVVEDE